MGSQQVALWISARIGESAASVHRKEIRQIKYELSSVREVLVDVVPVEVGRVSTELLVLTNARMFTVSKTVDVPLKAISRVSVKTDSDNPHLTAFIITTPDKRIPLRFDNVYREALLRSLREVSPTEHASDETAQAFIDNQKQAKIRAKAKKKQQADEEAKKSAFIALGANVAGFVLAEFVIWVPVVAVALAMAAWLDEQGNPRSSSGLGVRVTASAVAAVNAFLVAVHFGWIR